MASGPTSQSEAIGVKEDCASNVFKLGFSGCLMRQDQVQRRGGQDESWAGP